jgi:hypothetical protein
MSAFCFCVGPPPALEFTALFHSAKALASYILAKGSENAYQSKNKIVQL